MKFLIVREPHLKKWKKVRINRILLNLRWCNIFSEKTMEEIEWQRLKSITDMMAQMPDMRV